MAAVTFRLATEADEADLRQLLRQSPMPGAIAVTFEREPHYFHGAAIEGFHQAIVCRDQETGALLGMGSRSVRSVYVNGTVQPVGYMSQLRTNEQHQWGIGRGRVVAQAFRFFHTLHADGRAPFYLMSVVADNHPAQRLLTSGLPGFPHLQPYVRWHTYIIYLGQARRPTPLPAGLCLERGDAAHIPAILDCLQRNGALRQFAPYWSAETLFSPNCTPNLRPEDFLLALAGDRVVGCIAAWDQSRFKQTVVRGYTGPIGRWPLVRVALNWLSPVGGWPKLPAPDTPWRYCYASHPLVDAANPAVFAALVRGLYRHARDQGYSYFVLGLSEVDPLGQIVRKSYRHVTYPSQIYLVGWEDGLEAISRVDRRPPGLEIAVL
jgi:hypothetical protein